MSSKRTREELQIVLNEKYPGKYSVLGEYINQKTKILIKYNECGCEKELWVDAILKGCNCQTHLPRRYMSTHEFINKVENIWGKEFIILSKYNGDDKPILVWHLECKKAKIVSKAGRIIWGRSSVCSCNRGSNISKATRKNYEKFIKELNTIAPNKYEILSEYNGLHEYITIRHIQCGHAYEILPVNLLKSKGCKICSSKTTGSHYSFMKLLCEKQPNIFLIQEEYRGQNVEIKAIDLRCGHSISRKPCDMIKGRGCRQCQKGKALTHSDFVNKLENIFPNKYCLLSDFIKYSKNILVRYVSCGCVREVSPQSLMAGRDCFLHSERTIFSDTKEFKDQIEKLYPNRFEIIGEYSGHGSRILVKHIACGRISNPKARYLLLYGNCTECTMDIGSNGERIIADFLINNNIKFKRQKWFPDCRNILPLRFDIGILNKNKCVGLIEFQGPQHYSPISFNSNQSQEEVNKQFEIIKVRDNIKKEYVKENNIPFLEIPYYSIGNIQDILKQFLVNISIIKEDDNSGMES